MSEEEQLDPRETPAHPRHTYSLIGHRDAEQQLLNAYRSGKFHHGWLLGGPKGIGKATLAYRLARFILANPDPASPQVKEATDLYVDEHNPVAMRIASRGHSDLSVLTRQLHPKTKKLRAQISVDDARSTTGLFQRTAGEGGWRVCIVDAADDLNSASANSILKILEEPPKNSLFILVSHSPGRLLPTLRSRCLRLDLQSLSDDDVIHVLGQGLLEKPLEDNELSSLLSLADGSPGRAMQLLNSKGARQFIIFEKMVSQNSPFDLSATISIAETFQAKGTESEFNIFANLLADWLAQTARSFTLAGSPAISRCLASYHGDFTHSINRTNALNLDRRQTIMQALESIEEIIIPVRR